MTVMKNTYYAIARRYATLNVSYQDVLELEVSVDNPLFMYVIQSCSDLSHPTADFVDNCRFSRLPRNTSRVVKKAAL